MVHVRLSVRWYLVYRVGQTLIKFLAVSNTVLPCKIFKDFFCQKFFPDMVMICDEKD